MKRRLRSPRKRTLTSLLLSARSTVTLVSVLVIGVTVIPSSADVFRFPKDLIVRAETIILLALWILLAVRGSVQRFSSQDKPVLLLASACLVWTAITAALSTNRLLSVPAAFWAASVAVVLLTTYFVADQRRRAADLWFFIVPALVSAVLAILQASNIWNPFTFLAEAPGAQRVTGLIGNPNELGSYLVLPVLVCAAMAVVSRHRRWLYGGLSALASIAVVATRTRTAMIACAVGLVCIACAQAKTAKAVAIRLMAAVLIVAMILGVVAAVESTRLARLKQIDALNEILSFRVTPFLAAWKMLEDHPLNGVGPGCFAYWYFDYKIAVEREHPPLFHTGQGWSNFGEVHNDHLQILAETGVPGYLLFLAVLAFVAWHSFRSGDQTDNEELDRLARLLAFPIAATLFVLCLAQFPLQLASTTTGFGFVLTTAIGWARK